MKKHLLVKLLATTLACLFVISGITFPVFATETSTEDGLGDRLVAINISMSGQVSLLFYFKDIDKVDYYQVSIPQRNGTPDTKKVYTDSLEYDEGKQRYCLEVSVPAAQQNDTISVQSFDANDNPGKVRSYSIRDYANMLFDIAETDVETYYYACEAVKAMLNYGAMAQIRFSHFENNLANQGLYLDGTNPASGMTLDDMPRIPDKTSSSPSGIKTSAECFLDGKVALRIYIDELPTGTNINSIKPWIGSGRGDDRGELVEDTFKQDATGKYYAEVNNIPATRFDNLYDIEIRNQDGEVLMKTTYSVFNYIEDALLAEYSDLAGSMYLYHVWTSAYVNAAKNNITDIESGKDGIVKAGCEHTRTYTGLVVRPGKTCSDCGSFLRGFSELPEDHESRRNTLAYLDNVENFIYYNVDEGCTTSFTGFSVPVVISDLYKENETVNSFNRFSLTYYASEPVMVTMTYGNNQTTEYYLESGENTFWGVLPNFMGGEDFVGGETADKISKLEISPCKGTSTTFVLYNYTLEYSTIPADYSNGLVSIKGGLQKLTIDLFNGGAMTALYHDHLNGGVEDRYNLIKNVAATGLAQYEWQTDANTRLVDVQIKDDKTFVKVKYHLGGTSTYFECTYFADAGNYIRVDNRQIDFSGIDGEYRTSALPEFYTVSYMPYLFTYDGSNSWTGAASSYLTPSGTPTTYNFRSSSEETWCAWSPVTDAAQINIPVVGIYVPNVDSFEAEYTGPSTSMSPDTPNEYGRISMQKTIKTYSFEALEYSYFVASALQLDDGGSGGVRNVFKNLYNAGISKNLNEDLNEDYISTRIPDENPDMTNLNFAYEQMGLLLRDTSDDNAVVRYHAKNASAIVEATGNNPYCFLDFTLYDFLTAINPASTPVEYTADDYVQLRLTYMVPSDSNATSCTIWLYDDNGAEKEIVTVGLDKTDVYSTAVIDLSTIENWTGTISKLKLVFDGATEGDAVYIRGIQLLTEEKRIAGADFIDEFDAKDFLTVAPSDSMVYDDAEGAFKLVPGSVDPYFKADYTKNGLELEASKYHSVKFTYMIPENAYYANYHVDLYLDVKDSQGTTTTTKIRCSSIQADGKYHTVVIPLPQFAAGSTIVSARFDYLTYNDTDDKTNENYKNDVFYLYSFILSSKTQEEEIAAVDFTKIGSAGLMYSTGDLREEWTNEDQNGTKIYPFDYAYLLSAFVPSFASNQAGVEFDENMGALKLTATGTASDFVSNPEHFDPYVLFYFDGAGLKTDDYSGVRIKYKVAEDCSPNQRIQIFTLTSNMYDSEQENYAYDPNTSRINYIDVDGEFHEIEINLAGLKDTNENCWTGDIVGVRLDFFFVFYNGESNTMYITGIELIPAQ